MQRQENKRESFVEVCRKNGLKVTPQRVAIFNLIIKSDKHPTAECVHKLIKKKYPSISFDTVNRTLITFMKIGLVSVVEGFGSPRKFDPNQENHHHLHCLECGSIMDFYNNDFDKIKIPQKIKKEFKILSKRVVLNGVCAKCLKKNK